MKLQTTLIVLVLATCAALAPAQLAYVLADGAIGISAGVNLPTSGYPLGAPDLRPPLFLGAFAGSGTPAIAAPIGGGHAIDQVTAAVYSSDGFILQSEGHPLYGLAGGPPPVPVFGILTGGPITGLGVNSAPAGFLYMCDALSFQARAKVFPYAPAGPIIVPGFPHAPFTGIGYDPATATIWLVDAAGAVFHCTLAGAPIGLQPVAVFPSIFGAPITGLDVNTSNGAGSFPEPLCSTALPAWHVITTDGAFVYDPMGGGPPIPVGPLPLGPRALGLAFSSDAQDLGGAGPCGALVNGLNRPSVIGPIPGPVTAITCTGLAPFGTATLWIDLCPIPGGFPLGTAGTLWINPFAPPISAGAVANASGVASIPMPLSIAPANVTFAAQWFVSDPLNPPFFVCLSNGTIVTSGMP